MELRMNKLLRKKRMIYKPISQLRYKLNDLDKSI